MGFFDNNGSRGNRGRRRIPAGRRRRPAVGKPARAGRNVAPRGGRGRSSSGRNGGDHTHTTQPYMHSHHKGMDHSHWIDPDNLNSQGYIKSQEADYQYHDSDVISPIGDTVGGMSYDAYPGHAPAYKQSLINSDYGWNPDPAFDPLHRFESSAGPHNHSGPPPIWGNRKQRPPAQRSGRGNRRRPQTQRRGGRRR